MARASGAALGLPELGALQYLVDALLRLGPIRSDGMGPRPADWPEIDAFARQTGRVTEPWEAEAIFDMCHGYLDGLEAGKDPLGIAPADRQSTET